MRKSEYILTQSVPFIMFNNLLHVAPCLMDLEGTKIAVSNTNLDIENQIAIADEKATFELVKMKTLIAKSNNTRKAINRISKRADRRIATIILNLINDTNYTAHKMVEIGKANGYTIICELIMVNVGDRIVWIDPLRVAEF